MSKRYPIQLPQWHEKRLIWWAFMKGTNKTRLSQNTLQARIESNEEQIEAMLADGARDRNMSVEEFKEQILADAGFLTDEVDD